MTSGALEGNSADWSELLELATFQGGFNATIVTLGTTMLGIAAGVVGVFALLRRRSLVADALSHATLPGIAIAFMVSILLGGAEGDAREHAICACSAFAAAPEAVDALLAWFALTPRIGRTEEPPEGPHPWSDLFLGDDGMPAVPELFDYVLSDRPVAATPAQLRKLDAAEPAAALGAALERKALLNVQHACHERLGRYPSTLEADEAALARAADGSSASSVDG